jgi:probable rRNA maturation factor
MIEVVLDDPAWSAALADPEALARQAALAAIAFAAPRDIAILLTDDAAVRDLNRRFRGQDKATNVLSFPAPPTPGNPPGAPLGDIALAFGVCQAEAGVQGKPLADHLRHLVIHGVLHLAGYDHHGADDAARMERIERDLLAAMQVPDPYADVLSDAAHVEP